MFKIRITDVLLISYFDAPFVRNWTKLELQYKLQIDCGKGKDKFVVEETVKVHCGSRGGALLFLEPRAGYRCVVRDRPRSLNFRETDPFSMV